MTATGLKPIPEPDLPEFAAYWTGLASGKLLIPKCQRCGTFRWPPRPRCPECGHRSFEWSEVAAEGTLFSWTTVGRSFLPGFADAVPYTVGIVELSGANHIRVVGQVVGIPPERLAIGTPLRAVMESQASGVTLCNWTRL